MIKTGFETRVKVQQIIENQLPNFLLSESPKIVDFLKQYYISQEYQSGPADITNNLDQYLKLDNLTPEVISGSYTLSSDIDNETTTVEVNTTKGFPAEYGLFQIDDEIFTYTGITTNTFTGCVRGFSGVTKYKHDLNREELVFSESEAASHTAGASLTNLSVEFLKEFYNKLKYTFTPGLEGVDFVSDLDVNNFIKEARSFYQSKGTEESFKILFKVLYGVDSKIINLEDYLLKPSYANYARRKIVLVEQISGDITKITGQTLYKTSDTSTNAPISSVESFNSNGRIYHKISFYIGNDDRSSIQGIFNITPNTRITERVLVGGDVISVDSTVSFPDSGTILSGNNTITYTSKSINQFFGCSGITEELNPTDFIRTDDTYFSYENGDINKKVEVILFGVISDLEQKNNGKGVYEGDTVTIKNFGDKILNSSNNYKEVFANSWIYNTSTRYQIINNVNLKLGSTIDRSSLKVGDNVEILRRGSETVVSESTVYVSEVNTTLNTISLSGGNTGISDADYDIRRKLNKASSSGPSFEYGNDTVLSDVLNLYVDGDEYAYVASNSVPSKLSSLNEYRLDIDESIKTESISSLLSFTDLDGDGYNQITLPTAVPFITGDRILYTTDDESIIGLESGSSYYVKVTGSQSFKLYASETLIEVDGNIKINPPNPVGNHTFTLYSQRELVLGSQKLLRKIPLQKNIEKGSNEETVPGPLGILINGVEINNYKSKDSVYYGPLDDVNVVSGGENYDTINLPEIEVGIGSAKIQPVVSGTLKNVFVDSQNYDIDKIVSINISGGNGSGAVIEPVISKRSRSILFSADAFSNGGGVSTTSNQIFFTEEHNLTNGEEIIYNPLGSSALADLNSGSSYFTQVDNNNTITLYNSLSEQQTKTNSVTLNSTSFGIQQFETANRKNQVSYVQVLDGGSEYTNRKLIVKPSGISSERNLISFDGHGFESGELVNYDYQSSSISGLSTNNQYYILKIDDNSFRLSDAGVGGTITQNYDKGKFVDIESSGTGYQYFSYPDISVSIVYNPVGFGTTTQIYQELVTTPVVKGSVIDAYLYEGGSGYGSTIINVKKNPIISIKNGKDATLSPVIINGTINSVLVDYGGTEYSSIPDLIVTDSSGSGTGAQLRAIIDNGKIISVKVVNSGIGYSSIDTSIKVVTSGKNAILNSQVRKLTVNDSYNRFSSGKVLLSGNDKLQYSVSKYFEDLRDSFLESSGSISKIIGWAYDGNPIYGPYVNSNTGVKRLSSGYTIDISQVEDRPVGFASGYFIEDYIYDNSGDLDEHNGRYENNVEFPNGIYAYHATIDSSGNPEFPYFIGNTYNSKRVFENINQSFNLNESGLLRNTLPYKVSEESAGYDFIDEVDDSVPQKIEIESVSSGSIDSIDIVNSGDGYGVGDSLSFNEEGTSGQGLNAIVSSIKGKEVSEITTSSTQYLNSIFTWDNANQVRVSILPQSPLNSGDYVNISGFSTNISKLNGFYRIQVPSYTDGRCLSSITSATAGFTTEIYVAPIPDEISIGSSIGIGTETLKILGIFRNENIIRIERGVTGVSHTVGTAVSFLPDSFTISKNVDNFESRLNNKIFFNPRESVGVSTISGVGYSTSFTFGNIDIVEDIPSKSIRIENHPFITNQRISYTSAGSDITVSTDGVNTFSLNSLSNIFVINKQPNLIGLKTAISGNELFFHSNGSDDDQYLFETNYTQIFGDVEENKITVSVSTSHGLQIGDTVKLNVKPNLSVGIGTSTAVRVLYKSEIDAIVVDPIGFNSTGVSTTTNEITITDHGLVTGDKVFYEDASNSNVDKKSYYIFKINDNIFNLCETYFDTQQNPPSVVSFASTGGSSQTLSLINPEINPIRNNNLVFDLTDSSLSGYELKIFCENTFENEFVSTGSTNSFTISGVGTVGVSTNASLTLEYNSDLPQDLYYTLEQNGEQIGYDEDVINYSKIEYQNSKYNNSYNIDAITDTTFTINSRQKPERLSYASSETDALEYSTTSSNTEGAVNSISILDTGFGYKKLPSLKSVDTTNGRNLIITTQSSSLGADKDIRVINNNYIYSSDKTLSPTASLPYFVGLTNSATIDSVDVVFGGNGYTSAPEIILINPDTREVINSGILQANIQSQSIVSVDVVESPKGIPDDSADLFTVNNTNGISIVSVETSNSGIYTCSLLVPFGGFDVPPFSNGDKVFIENIVRGDTNGSGFNSDEYDYKFLDVTLFDSGAGKVTIDVSGLTTNTGIAATVQNLSGTIINQSDYPSFVANVSSSQSKFLPNESVKVNGNTTDLIVLESDRNYLRLSGSYNLQENDRITGNLSSSAGNVNTLELNTSSFKIEYGNDKNIGWLNDIGKLSIDTQVTPDNDYYQNLSYSVKSPITYNEQKSAVENLVHSSGLKNFADTELLTASAVGFGSDSSTSIIYDLLGENRVDTINNYDNVVDIDVNSPSRFIKLENKKLSDYIELRDLNALKIDNIQRLFSNFESENTLFLDIEEVDDIKYQKYLIRVTDSNSTEIQLTDITVLSNGLDSFIAENESISNVGSGEIHENGEQYGSFVLDTTEFNENFLRFVPVDPFNTDYDLKIIRQVFNPSVSGVGTTSIGFIDLIGSKDVESTGTGSTSIVEVNPTDFNSLYVVAQVIDKVTNDMDYVKIYVRHDGTNTYQTEYYIDTDFGLLSAYNADQIGTFTSNLDGGTLSINHDNNTGNEIEIFTNIIGFGNTSVGVGTFRYILDGQIVGNERSAIYESNYYTTSAASPVTIQTLDGLIFDSSKCVIEVSAGSTKALHQVIMVADDNDVYTQQAPFLSVSDDSLSEYDDAAGIGTFGGSISGSDILITFYPDATQTGQIDIEVFSKSLYKTLDVINEPEELSYGSVSESIDEKLYNSINGDRINRFNFGLFNNNTPIFSKTFDPNSSVLTSNTGIFTIANHFFETGEELIYTPKSTFIGVSTSPLQTSTGDLPSTVYAIKLTEDTFKVATSFSDAQSGIGATFTSLGSGNAHQFTMAVRNSKTIITLDDLVQYPIAPTKITHTLDGNVGAAISETTEIISLSGISTINPTDILRIDDEYMNVVNVGLGTTNLGPITNSGTETLVKVDRGFVGSTASTHTDSTLVRVYKGAFNIVDNDIYFAQPPRGNPQINKTEKNLDFETSEFTGRVFLRSDYSTNQIYDDISDEFSGIGRTFTLRVGGANTVGLGSTGGSGLVFINSFYQSPQTENNPNRFNYTINEDTVAGITTLTFSAITVPDSNPLEYITSDYDINLNGVPRGGIIISYGSTSGLGFAPLVGASVTATVSAGSITAIGIGTTGTFGSGYNGLTAIGVSVYESGHTGGVADISATIGIGGTLAFTINDGGSGYTNPKIFVSDPSYENLPIIGVSRLGIGATTDTGSGLLLDVEVGSATGIGSTLFEVKDFKFARPGYQFQRGDVFKPVGLVTDASLASPLQDFEITVVDTFSDSFAAWEFGKLDYIDSIANLQDGERVRFPLNYNTELLSFEAGSGRPVSQNLSNMLLIFNNGVLQDPGVNYTFEGGSSFVFTTPPKPDDNVQIYFYRGSDGDTTLVSDVNQSLEIGDTVQILKNNYIAETIEQKERIVYNLSFSDKFQTNIYDDVGIDENNLKPLRWTKQKRGLFINGQYVEKVRDSIEALVFPTSKIIKDFNSTDNSLFVDNVEIFEYEDNNSYGEPSTPFNALVVNGISTETSGSVEFMENFTQIVGSSGIVTGISTSQGVGTPLALTFDIYDFSEELSDLQVGYPIYIYDTMIGSGVTSIDDSDSAVVGVSTEFLDNVYYIAAITESGPIGVITCNVKSDSDIIGLSTVGITSSPVGKFSWGRISNSAGLTRANPISIGVSGNIVSGLSTYPTIQRRGGVNLRSTGALPKIES